MYKSKGVCVKGENAPNPHLQNNQQSSQADI